MAIGEGGAGAGVEAAVPALVRAPGPVAAADLPLGYAAAASAIAAASLRARRGEAMHATPAACGRRSAVARARAAAAAVTAIAPPTRNPGVTARAETAVAATGAVWA